MELISLFFAAMIIQNVVLTQFLGLCPFLGVSKNKSAALGMGVAVTFVIFCSSIITYFVNKILVWANVEYLDLVIFILIVASFVQLVEMFMKVKMPKLYQSLGIYLPLITTNCAVMYVVLNNITLNHDLAQLVVYSLAVPLGFTLILFLYTSIRQRIAGSLTPKYFKGNPIGLVAAGLMAIAFSGLAGIL